MPLKYMPVAVNVPNDAEILRRTEEMCRATGDWQPYDEWRGRIARQIADDQARLR